MKTIFSVDPKTGQPYMTPERAIVLAKTHINRTSKNLLNHHNYTMEDLVQEVMVKMSTCEFDPEKSAVNTFFFMCATSCLGNVVKMGFKSNDRHKCGSDFIMFDNDGEAVLATEHLGIEHTTPEDYLNASETVTEHFNKSDREAPEGWSGFRNKKTIKYNDFNQII